jgi:hypothetical protein
MDAKKEPLSPLALWILRAQQEILAALVANTKPAAARASPSRHSPWAWYSPRARRRLQCLAASPSQGQEQRGHVPGSGRLHAPCNHGPKSSQRSCVTSAPHNATVAAVRRGREPFAVHFPCSEMKAALPQPRLVDHSA